MSVPTTEKRQIENEMIFRRANEKIGNSLDELDSFHAEDGNHELIRSTDLDLEFLCECSDENCLARIPLKLSAYQKIHSNRKLFILKPNHEVKAIEVVVEKKPKYSVVKKNNSIPEPDGKLNDTDVNNS